jgi:UDP:flavonoid glycosyltransferase YjiC (YdhE family)
MARILFVWELGKGFGHLAPYLGLVEALLEKKYQVVFVARDVGNTEKLFGAKAVAILQAPIMMHNIANPYRIQYNLSHLLHNTGFAEVRSVFGLVKAWRHVYDYVRPDLVMFDHSPIALLAARAYPWKRIVSGSGFLIPPRKKPLPMMRYWQQYDQERLLKEENGVLANMNRVLEAVRCPPMDAVADLYAADEEFHLSFKELDHYPDRGDATYLGMFSPPNHGVAPVWPEGGAKKVFAYLHPYRQLPALLELLAQSRLSTIVYAPEVQVSIKNKHRGNRMVYSSQPLDLTKVAAECDLAITNGTFGTTAAFLLHGRQVLAIPTNLERVMVARRLMAVGAGLGVQPNQPEKLKPALRALLSTPRFATAAQKFRDQYGHLDLAWQTRQMVERIETLLAAGGRTAAVPPPAPGAARSPAAPPAAAEGASGQTPGPASSDPERGDRRSSRKERRKRRK